MSFSKLRKLEPKDVDGMIEWMTDPEQTQYFTFDASDITRDSALKFIENAQDFSNDRHYAIVDDKDEYLGTISLKNIRKNQDAEYAVSIRKQYIGSGVSFDATLAVLEVAFNELNLEKVYLNVLATNTRAIRFYQKMGFSKDDSLDNDDQKLEWYSIYQKDFQRIVRIKTNADNRGALSVIENNTKELPFAVQRMFYIYNVKGEESRGNHANRKSNFLMIALNGRVEVEIDDGTRKTSYVLDRPNIGLRASKMTWKVMRNFSEDCVLAILADEKYDPDEYITDYDEFKKEVAL